MSSLQPSTTQPSTALTLYQPDSSRLAVVKTVTSLVIVNAEIKAEIKDFSAALIRLDTKTSQNQTEVIVLDACCLDASFKAVEQITTNLLNHHQIERIHILAQGRPGGVKLGSSWLSQTGLEAHSESLRLWQTALTAEAQIMLHCPNVAMGTEGMGFLGRLSQLTGAIVVASNLSIGNPTALQQGFSPANLRFPLAG